MNALLLDCKERAVALELADDAPDQATRLQLALEQRNKRMVGPGQEFWNHACTLCCEMREVSPGVFGE
jgi:hypothetical protein